MRLPLRRFFRKLFSRKHLTTTALPLEPVARVELYGIAYRAIVEHLSQVFMASMLDRFSAASSLSARILKRGPAHKHLRQTFYNLATTRCEASTTESCRSSEVLDLQTNRSLPQSESIAEQQPTHALRSSERTTLVSLIEVTGRAKPLRSTING